MVYKRKKNSGTIMNDPNQQILSPLKVVSKQDAYLFGRLVNDATAPTDTKLMKLLKKVWQVCNIA